MGSRERWLAVGYTAGLAVAAGASWVRVWLAGSLRIETSAAAFWQCSLLLGAGLLLAAICSWKLIQAAEGIPARTTLLWAVPGYLILAFAAPITSADFYQYVAYGLLDLAGKNPLAVGPNALDPTPLLNWVPARWLLQPSMYGPVLLALFRLGALLGKLAGAPLWGAMIATKLLMGLATFLALVLAARVTTSRRAIAMLAFSPLLAWELTGQGHSDALVLLALVLFVWAATADRELLAVLAITAGTLAKLTMAPVLALYLLFLLRKQPLRAVLYGFAGLALTALLSLPYVKGFAGITPFLGAVRGTRSHSLGDLLAIVVTPLGPAAQDAVVRASFFLCIALCAVAFGATVLRARTVQQLLLGCLLFLLVWDLTVPLFQTWYISWLFPLALRLADKRWLRLVALYGTFSVLQWAVQLDPLTTVVINGWVVWQMVRLLRSPAPDERGEHQVAEWHAPVGAGQ
ncbi:MAG TPA: hypothetical protein VH083_11490 [Myxococcales bacterium]|jgi:hypothetical protein|nr:hypothetical protein [Myxococcales bacterium]